MSFWRHLKGCTLMQVIMTCLNQVQCLHHSYYFVNTHLNQACLNQVHSFMHFVQTCHHHLFESSDDEIVIILSPNPGSSSVYFAFLEYVVTDITNMWPDDILEGSWHRMDCL